MYQKILGVATRLLALYDLTTTDLILQKVLGVVTRLWLHMYLLKKKQTNIGFALQRGIFAENLASFATKMVPLYNLITMWYYCSRFCEFCYQNGPTLWNHCNQNYPCPCKQLQQSLIGAMKALLVQTELMKYLFLMHHYFLLEMKIFSKKCKKLEKCEQIVTLNF